MPRISLELEPETPSVKQGENQIAVKCLKCVLPIWKYKPSHLKEGEKKQVWIKVCNL